MKKAIVVTTLVENSVNGCGKAGNNKKIADELIAAKGVKHGKPTFTGSGKDLPA